jgi:hypothetical protein
MESNSDFEFRDFALGIFAMSLLANDPNKSDDSEKMSDSEIIKFSAIIFWAIVIYISSASLL